jgi:hypothetical protein
MNLNNLKPAWRQFRLINSMEPIDQEEILSIIAGADRETIKRMPMFMINTIMVMVLIVFCQAG